MLLSLMFRDGYSTYLCLVISFLPVPMSVAINAAYPCSVLSMMPIRMFGAT